VKAGSMSAPDTNVPAQQNLPSQQKIEGVGGGYEEMISSCLRTLLVEAF
jgi:hypothetical protein